MDPLDLVQFLPRLIRNLIPVAFVIGFFLFHGLTMRLFDDVVYYKANQIQSQLRQGFQLIVTNERRAERREIRAASRAGHARQ